MLFANPRRQGFFYVEAKLQTEVEFLMNNGIWIILEFQNCENYINGIGLDKQNFEHNIENIFLPISFNVCFGYSKETSH